ncbi:hypothetical protein PVL29_021024 [Vitis rotundifolia]|uniref:Leucine-rich repeat-containing N-terminal plant-type domain-containing protein n=1 Tax=Vitis rotundifolia TaxID=103349 RepID=A0AA38YYH2_VITRO|nr:hypothetical protein PVL29_021024 [Vitis rotundifolia]
MRNSRPIILFPLLCFLSSTISILCDLNTLVCNEKEKHALLRFKKALSDPGNRLSSWSVNQDCCRWEAVYSNNVTGWVVRLALLGSMGSLRYLDLSFAEFRGLVLHQLGNLSTLRHLDLGYNRRLYVENLGWISHLAFLKYLGMNWVDLHREVHWLESVSMFPSLSELHLSHCELDSNMTSSLGYANFTSLTFLDLSENNFNQEIPNWLFKLSSLVSLSLSFIQFKGQISESLGQLKYLEYLDVSFNSFHGPIPTSIGNLSSLRYLGLSENPLINGTLPMSLGLLSNLEYLNVGWTSLTGTISEVYFTALSKLKGLSISGTSLSFHFLGVDSCKMGPKFPTWLQTQKSLSYLDFSRSGIVDTAPNWFWKFASYVQQIHLSNNQISGDLSQVVLNNTIIDLSSNCFSGRLPRLSPNVVVLNIANNSFSGQISPFMCQKMNGRSKLEVLDISINALSGKLSDCWMHWPNNLSGKIPNSMGSLVGLKALSLHNNSFYGDIPSSLENCKVLGLINPSDNKFLGIIPRTYRRQYDIWYDALEADYDYEFSMESLVLDTKGREVEYEEILKYVRMIDLSSNNLSGSIPIEISSLFGLRFLNLSQNHLMGRIPEKIGVMALLEYLDLSRNHLLGEIPQSMSNFTFLDDLDLSFNNFFGRIPSSTQLQSFDPLSFFGNPELCGAPLTKNCTKDEETLGPTAVEENREFPEISWFYIGMGSGFIAGFWGVCGALFFKRAWRHAYFQFLYDMRDWAYVAIAIKLKWFHQKLRRYHAG